MLGGATGFMLTIGSNHAPAKLKSEDCQDEVDEASGSHEKKYSTGHRLPFAPNAGMLVRKRSKTLYAFNAAVFSNSSELPMYVADGDVYAATALVWPRFVDG